jgi:predicted transposase/invertase (TIGR01784 family)
MTEDDFIKLGSLSTLFRFIKASGNKDELNDLITKNESFKKTDVKMMELLNNILDLNIEIKDTEDINMCKAIEDMKKDAKKEGKQEAINENIKTMYSNGFDENMIAKALSLDINFVKKVLA